MNPAQVRDDFDLMQSLQRNLTAHFSQLDAFLERSSQALHTKANNIPFLIASAVFAQRGHITKEILSVVPTLEKTVTPSIVDSFGEHFLYFPLDLLLNMRVQLPLLRKCSSLPLYQHFTVLEWAVSLGLHEFVRRILPAVSRQCELDLELKSSAKELMTSLKMHDGVMFRFNCSIFSCRFCDIELFLLGCFVSQEYHVYCPQRLKQSFWRTLRQTSLP
jgi:hypothetical protein